MPLTPGPARAGRWHWGAAVLALIAAAIAWLVRLRPVDPPAAPSPDRGPAPEVLTRLRRGVSLSGRLQRGLAREVRANAPTSEDWRRVAALGLRHVRIPLDPGAFEGPRGLRHERQELEARDVGWSHWVYAGAFGLVEDARADAQTAEALGLKAR